MVTVELPDIGPFVMEVHSSGDRYISDAIRRTGCWEPFETEVFARLLAADVEFFDVGANIGWYSMLAGKRLESRGTVHAFEPVPENVALLAHNAAANALKQTPASVLARITGARKGAIVDGLLDDDVCNRMLDSIERSCGGSIHISTAPRASPSLSRWIPKVSNTTCFWGWGTFWTGIPRKSFWSSSSGPMGSPKMA